MACGEHQLCEELLHRIQVNRSKHTAPPNTIRSNTPYIHLSLRRCRLHPRTASEEAYRVAADYLDRLATRDPFVEKVATVLRVAIFKMPELYQKFEVSETLMSLIRSGMTCRLTCP